MTHRVALLLLLWPLWLTAQTPPADPAPVAVYRISGTVVDRVTGALVARATVSIGNNSSYDVLRTVLTGPDGRFDFEQVAPGKYSLQARRRGYVAQGFEQHENFWTGIVTGPELKSTGLVFRIAPEGVISGKIVDDQLDAVAGARVMVYGQRFVDGTLQTIGISGSVSDDLGEYRVADLAPGKYWVEVQAEPWYAQRTFDQPVTVTAGSPESPRHPQIDVAFPVTYYPNVADLASATPIRLAAGQHFAANFQLAPVPTYRLRVHTGQPAGAQSSAMLTRRGVNGEEQRVAGMRQRMANDVVELSGMPAGNYEIATSVYAEGRLREWRQQVRVVADADIAENLSSPDGVQLSGQVRCDDGELPKRTGVMLRSDHDRHVYLIDPGDDGTFRLEEPVARDSYSLSLEPGSQLIIGSIVARGARVNGRRLEIGGSDPVQLQISCGKNPAEITGAARHGDAPAAAAMILLVPADLAGNDDRVRRDQSDSDGTFLLRGIVPGAYILMAIQDGWDIEWANPEILKPYLARGQRVDIRPGGKYADIRVPVQ
jgi:hypothetical protein